MALPSSFFKSDPIVVCDQSIYESTTGQTIPPGTRIKVGERTFHYTQANGSFSAGDVVCAYPVSQSFQLSGQLICSSAPLGATYITVVTASFSLNFTGGGYFGVSTGTNQGDLYAIKSFTSYAAFVGTTAGLLKPVIVKLADPLRTAITSGSSYWIMRNPFEFAAIGTQNTDTPMGVAMCVASTFEGVWIQTWGLANAKHEAVNAAGAALRVGTTGGLITAFNSTTNDASTLSAWIIAKNTRLPSTANECSAVFLTIVP